jgi:hypothetical protein
MVKLPPAVREFTFRPLISSLKFPDARLGVNPAIKLSVAGTQVGVNGTLPVWLAVATTSAAWAGPDDASNIAKNRRVAAFQVKLCG